MINLYSIRIASCINTTYKAVRSSTQDRPQVTTSTVQRNFNSCQSKTLKKRQKSHRINNLYATNKNFSSQLPIVPHCRKIIYNLWLECSPVLQMNQYLKVHQNSVLANSFYTNLHFQTCLFFWPENTLIANKWRLLCIILALQDVCQFSF